MDVFDFLGFFLGFLLKKLFSLDLLNIFEFWRFLDFYIFLDIFDFFLMFCILFKVTKVTNKRYGGYYRTPKMGYNRQEHR